MIIIIIISGQRDQSRVHRSAATGRCGGRERGDRSWAGVSDMIVTWWAGEEPS